MKVKITLHEELVFSEILYKLKPENRHFKNFRSELSDAIDSDYYEKYDHDTDAYSSDEWYPLYYPVTIVFIDEDGKETDIENASDWYWFGKKDRVTKDERKNVITFKEFLKKVSPEQLYDNGRNNTGFVKGNEQSQP